MKHSPILLFLCALLSAGCGKGPADVPDPTCIEDLFGYRVAVNSGDSYDQLISQYPEITPVRVGGGEVLVTVQKGKADYGMSDSISCLSVDISEYGLEPKFTGFRSMDYPIVFSRGSAGLCARFNDFVMYADSTGLLQRLKNKWVNADESVHVLDSLDLPRSGKPMKIAAAGIMYPYTYYSGNELTGFQTDMMRHFSAWSGIPVEIKFYDISAAIQELQINRLDATYIPITINEERAQMVMASIPYIHDGGMCFGRIKGYVDRESFFSKVKNSFLNNLITENRWTLMADGLWLTIYVSLLSVLLATAIGALICRMRMSGRRFAAGFAGAFVEVVRSIPLLVLLMLLFYVVLAPLQLPAQMTAVICFGLYFGAYMSETFRTGIEGIDAGQWEAGAALGMKRFMTFRKVVLPQAMLRIIPVYKGQMITLVKSTSIIGYVAIMDLTKAGDVIRARTFDAFFPLLFVAAIYLLVSWLFGLGLDILEKRLTPKSRRI
ncbi:MAG: ABC transporter substrate-binding protein/permease [Bacteroidaceae bacterium]|nr:ABC transporter substrate-binding protein/permease [Bacteroidaceae bacterium]